MAIFGQNHGLTPFEKCQFFDFFNFLFLQHTEAFFGSRISQKTFSWISLPKKKKVGKTAIFEPRPWVDPFGKISIFRLFLTSLFYSLGRRLFLLEYGKRHFAGLYCLKKKLRKWPFFGPKSWVNPFGKMSIFRFFEVFVFIGQKGVYSFQDIVKDIFLAFIPKKKSSKNGNFEQKPWVNPFGKMSVFRLF